MNILKDMDLFVRVVHCDGLAAAGRELGMTPSSVTMRIKNLEEHYKAKLLTRTTRSISLTEVGRNFYEDSLRMLDEIQQVETKLSAAQGNISGPLRITTTSDIGRQHIAPLINDFVKEYPDVKPFLNLSDSVTDLTENNIDVAIRYGNIPDRNVIATKIADGRRVLCASPSYLERAGTPQSIAELKDHSCLTVVHARTSRSKWYFNSPQGEKSITIQPSRSCDDGALLRQWALEGVGITLKSIWDVAKDIEAKRLVTVLDNYDADYRSRSHSVGSDLYIAYPNRKYTPARTREFVAKLKRYFNEYLIPVKNKID